MTLFGVAWGLSLIFVLAVASNALAAPISVTYIPVHDGAPMISEFLPFRLGHAAGLARVSAATNTERPVLEPGHIKPGMLEYSHKMLTWEAIDRDGVEVKWPKIDRDPMLKDDSVQLKKHCNHKAGLVNRMRKITNLLRGALGLPLIDYEAPRLHHLSLPPMMPTDILTGPGFAMPPPPLPKYFRQTKESFPERIQLALHRLR
jgi:hypothetical protein